jgi:hypothetical protein
MVHSTIDLKVKRVGYNSFVGGRYEESLPRAVLWFTGNPCIGRSRFSSNEWTDRNPPHRLVDAVRTLNTFEVSHRRDNGRYRD